MNVVMEHVDGASLALASEPDAAYSADTTRTAFERRVAGYAAKSAEAWQEAEHAPHGFGAAVPHAEKLERERRADQDAQAIEAMLRRLPAAPARRRTWREELLQAVRRMARGHLGGDADGLNQLLTSEGVEATRQFVQEAKAFAPNISDSNLFQALRNVWVTHSVQLLLRAPITLSPSVFAYSMLYPWTDNCLDDPQLSADAKRAFGNWLTLRLAGLDGVAPDAHCGEVSVLVARIEGQYPRPEFPDVYFSLQAIHKAQMHSLQQQDASRDWGEQALLDLSIAKGGASVLADASLVRGWLSHEEAEFMFAYGVVLQLIDDLQDLGDDLRNRHMTLFTRQAGLGALDALTTRFWAFTRLVLGSFNRFASAQSASMKRLLQDNLRFIVLQSVARHRRFYTPAFVSLLEESSPVRFCYLARQEKTLTDRYAEALRSIRQKHRLQSVFDMLD